MDQAQNGEAMTPTPQVRTTDIVADLTRVLVEHSLKLEGHIGDLQAGHRALTWAKAGVEENLAGAHEKADRASQHIGELQQLAFEAFALVGAAFSRGSQPITNEWMHAAEAWAERWHSRFPAEGHRHLTDGTPLPGAEPAQTDAQPTEGDEGTHGGTCKCPRSEFGTTVCKTDTATTPPTSAG